MPQSTESTDSQSAPQTAYLPTNPQAGVAAIVDESVHPGKFDDHKGSSSGVDNSIKLASSSFEADIRSKRKESFWNIYRSTTFQFFIVGCLAFAGPAQSDAIANLGGGGLATPYTANAASAGSYAIGAFVALFGGPIVGKIGLKWTMLLGAATFPLKGSSMYCNSHYGIQWYLIAGYCVAGAGSALWYVSETGIVLSYPEPGRRGAFLAWWIVSRNLGQLIGGAINLSVNVNKSSGGGVSSTTYLIFVAIECLGLPAALFFSEPSKVRRKDGTRVVMAPKLSFKEELLALWKVVAKPRTLLLLPYFFISFFYIPVYGTYLNLHFSVRARALSSLIAPAFCIVGCFALGWVLDLKKLSQPMRAKIGFIGCIVIPTIAICIYTVVVLAGWETDPISAAKHYDWSDKGWARAYMPFFLVQTFGPMSQSFMFWLLSCFAEDVQSNTRNGGVFRATEAVGMAVCYGINSHAGTIWAGIGTYFGVFLLMIPMTWLVIRTVPEISPMEARANEELAQEKQGEA